MSYKNKETEQVYMKAYRENNKQKIKLNRTKNKIRYNLNVRLHKQKLKQD